MTFEVLFPIWFALISTKGMTSDNIIHLDLGALLHYMSFLGLWFQLSHIFDLLKIRNLMKFERICKILIVKIISKSWHISRFILSLFWDTLCFSFRGKALYRARDRPRDLQLCKQTLADCVNWRCHSCSKPLDI